jgi:hypothetical protein
MNHSALYRRRAQECATLRDRARSELGRARLDRECADWIALAKRAGGETLGREERSWRPAATRLDAAVP